MVAKTIGRVTVFVPLALLLIMNSVYWAATIETLAWCWWPPGPAQSSACSVGIFAARHPAVGAALRPALDLMQTRRRLLPHTDAGLFGLGVVPGIVSTVIFALPAPIA